MRGRVSLSQGKRSESLVSLRLADGPGKSRRSPTQRTERTAGRVVHPAPEAGWKRQATGIDVTGIVRGVITLSQPCGDGGGGTVTNNQGRCGRSSAGPLHARNERRGFAVFCGALQPERHVPSLLGFPKRSPNVRGRPAARVRARGTSVSWPPGLAHPEMPPPRRWSG